MYVMHLALYYITNTNMGPTLPSPYLTLTVGWMPSVKQTVTLNTEATTWVQRATPTDLNKNSLHECPSEETLEHCTHGTIGT